MPDSCIQAADFPLVDVGWVARSRGRITSVRQFGRLSVINYHPDSLDEISWGTLAHNSHPIKQNQRLPGHLFCWQFVWFSRLQLPRDLAALPRRACFPVDSIQARLEHVDGVAEAQERRGLALLCVPQRAWQAGAVILLAHRPFAACQVLLADHTPRGGKRVAARAVVKQSQVLKGSARRVASLAAEAQRGDPPLTKSGLLDLQRPSQEASKTFNQPVSGLDDPVQPWCEIEVPRLPFHLANGIETQGRTGFLVPGCSRWGSVSTRMAPPPVEPGCTRTA